MVDRSNSGVADLVLLNRRGDGGRVPWQVLGCQGDSGLSLSRRNSNLGHVAVLPGSLIVARK